MAGPWEKYQDSTESSGGAPWEKYAASAEQKPPDQRGVMDKLLGIGGERYVTFPERVIRAPFEAVMAGASATKKAATGQYGPTGAGAKEDPEVFQAATLGLTPAPRAASALGRGLISATEPSALSAEQKLEQRAVETVTKKLEGAGKTATQALQEIAQGRAAGKPMTLADVGGKQTQRLAGSVYRSGGAGAEIADQFLEQRDNQAAQRLSQDITKYVHGGETMHQTVDALLQSRSIEGRPLWDAVRAKEGVWSPRLQEFIRDPTFKQAMAAGYKEERLEALAEGRPFDPYTLGLRVEENGDVTMVKAPNMHVLHIGKKGLDAMVEANRDPVTQRLTSMGVALDKARRAYVDEIDSLDVSGTYKKARAAWEGRTKSFQAVRDGQGVFNKSPDQIGAEFNLLSDSDKEFYRIGVADKLRERLAKAGISADESKAIMKNPWTRDQLRPVFKSEADFNKFVEAVTAEQKMFRTNVATRGGSQTAERVAGDEQNAEIGMRAAETGVQVLSGHWIAAARNALRTWRDLGARPDPKFTEKLAKLLFSDNPSLELPPQMPMQDVGSARALEAATPALVPTAGSALAEPSQSR